MIKGLGSSQRIGTWPAARKPVKTYRVPRFGDVPDIDIVPLDRKDLPSAGAGETPIVGIAPAVGNAIFAVTGVRLRGMPLVPGDVVPQGG
jgi:CO/xanthine dehydrogenase Mo-binding subunit